MHRRSSFPAPPRRHFRTLSDHEALRASQALQQMAPGIADDPAAPAGPAATVVADRPAASSRDRRHAPAPRLLR